MRSLAVWLGIAAATAAFGIPAIFAAFLPPRGVFRVPILGWSIRAAGFVPVDRGDRVASLATVETALARLQKGRSLVVFPEETRTRTGELLAFKKGAALLAL